MHERMLDSGEWRSRVLSLHTRIKNRLLTVKQWFLLLVHCSCHMSARAGVESSNHEWENDHYPSMFGDSSINIRKVLVFQ